MFNNINNSNRNANGKFLICLLLGCVIVGGLASKSTYCANRNNNVLSALIQESPTLISTGSPSDKGINKITKGMPQHNFSDSFSFQLLFFKVNRSRIFFSGFNTYLKNNKCPNDFLNSKLCIANNHSGVYLAIINYASFEKCQI